MRCLLKLYIVLIQYLIDFGFIRMLYVIFVMKFTEQEAEVIITVKCSVQ